MTLVLKDAALLREQGFIDGAWASADSGARFAVTDPATGTQLAQVADMGAAETRRAIAAADRALYQAKRSGRNCVELATS